MGEATSGTIGHEDGVDGSPAIPVRVSRFRGTVQQDPIQWQETQIVQSYK